MAVELKFSKPDVGSHWGFRLIGGADFNEPLVVVKVNENSFAENAGLMQGDVVVRVNDTPMAGLSHLDAHDIINQAGCEFVMAVRRGLFSDIPNPSEDDSNEEVANILGGSQQQAEEVVAEKSNESILGTNKDQAIGSPPINAENLAGQEQTVHKTKSKDVTIQRSNKSRKWSTFLVKPKNPKPESKKLYEERKIIGEPYKVKIIKQPKRNPKDVLNRRKSVQFEPVVTEVEISRDTSIADSVDSLDLSDREMEVEASVQITEETTVQVEELDNEEPVVNIIEEESEDQCTIKKLKPILKPSPLDIHIDPVICESSLSLEEQLEAVQKQLLALSQLPTAIQVTLEAVTQQLNKIVLGKTSQVENDENGDCTEENGSVETLEENGEDNASLSENAEGDLTDNEAEGHSLEELEDDHVVNGNEVEDCPVESGNECEDQPEETVEVDPYAGLTEEEKEEKMREERLLAKKQKVNRWNQMWPWGDKEKPVYSSRESNCFMVPRKTQEKIHQFSEIPTSTEEFGLSAEIGGIPPDPRHGATG